jgi:hypothetical protein
VTAVAAALLACLTVAGAVVLGALIGVRRG